MEGKFKKGDWISNGRYTKLIVGINSDWHYYMFEDGTSKRIKGIDEKYHLWSIQDAKDGDVLVTTFEEDNMIVMYHSMCTIDTINVHCCLDNKFTRANLGVFDVEDVKPATKKQRDILFEEMQEKGYEWDAEKKELKKTQRRISAEAKEALYDSSLFGEDEKECDTLADKINELHERYPEISFAKLSRICVSVSKWQKKKIFEDFKGYFKEG